MNKDLRKFRSWCDEYFTKNDCCIEDKDDCIVFKKFKSGEIRTQAQAIRECAKRSIPKEKGMEMVEEAIWHKIMKATIRQLRDYDIGEIRRLIIERGDDKLWEDTSEY